MTTLVEGRVNIECGNTVVALTPGLMAAVADSKVTTREVNVESYISWTRDQFSFSEERLEDLLKKISAGMTWSSCLMMRRSRIINFPGLCPGTRV